MALLSACGDGRSRGALCAYCENDAQCAGNPCFEDVSGSRFCGAPCDSCPAGFSCVTVAGTGRLMQTCFPETESCAPTVNPGGGGSGPPVLNDMGKTPGVIVSGPVGAGGGSVDRLLFGITGDTRPDRCGTVYPQEIIDGIFTRMAAHGVQFAVDQGDHMFVCGFSDASFALAQVQMARYVSAASRLGRTVFMTMGNHECTGSGAVLCRLTDYSANPNYTAFMDALAPISPKPYYRFDVQTQGGLAVFIVIADDTWDAEQESWLEAQLSDADARARYTFVSKHHPDRNRDHPEFQRIYDLVRAHKYTLFLTGHSHLYKRQSSDRRALVIGCGGAPLTGGEFWGYGTVRQGADNRIYVTIYDAATDSIRDAFDVAPQ